MRLGEEPLSGHGTIGMRDRKVVDRREHGLLARAQTVMAMLIKREDPIASFGGSMNTGTLPSGSYM